LPFYLRRRILLLFCGNGLHVDWAKVFVFGQEFVEGVWWVYRFKFLSRIFACILQDDLGASWVLCRGKQSFTGQLRQSLRGVPSRNSVTSYALPCTITQHDSLELCFAISSPVRLPPSAFSLSNRFIMAQSEKKVDRNHARESDKAGVRRGR
jgi:hypothetical protein